MDSLELKQYENILVDKKNTLTKRLAAILKDDQLGGAKLAEEYGDDQAAILANSEVLEKIGSVDSKELMAVYSALSRLKNNNYGTCVKCGDLISKKRLDALPEAHYCINCSKATDA